MCMFSLDDIMFGCQNKAQRPLSKCALGCPGCDHHYYCPQMSITIRAEPSQRLLHHNTTMSILIIIVTPFERNASTSSRSSSSSSSSHHLITLFTTSKS